MYSVFLSLFGHAVAIICRVYELLLVSGWIPGPPNAPGLQIAAPNQAHLSATATTVLENAEAEQPAVVSNE